MLRSVAVVLAAVFALSVAAHAVPAWGRRTGADCSSCHWGLNKLNHTGRMFLLRGHRMPDEEGVGTEGYNLTEYTSWASEGACPSAATRRLTARRVVATPTRLATVPTASPVATSTRASSSGEVGIVNSGGGNANPNVAETNNFKDLYATLEYVLDENGSGIGVYGYTGKYQITPGNEDKFDRVGVFANYTTPQYTISAGALSGKHDVPASRRVRTWFAELGYNFTDTVLGWVRYDHFYRDIAADPQNRLVGLSVGVSYRLGNVGRLVVEYRNRKFSGQSDRNDLVTEVNWLF